MLFLRASLAVHETNITLAVDKSLLNKARVIAAQRGASVSGLLAQELLKIVERENAYQSEAESARAPSLTPTFRSTHTTRMPASVSAARPRNWWNSGPQAAAC
jgi:hypothetical protein